MSQTVIGVFESYSPAQQAARDLMAAGIDRDDIRISHRQEGEKLDEDKGFWESMKEAFGFGDDDDQYGYREATRRGGTVVSVDVDDQQLDTVTTIFEKHGVMDLDQQAQEWGKQGWSGYKNYQAVSTSQQLSQDQNSAATNTQAARKQSTTSRAAADQVVPVVKENLQIGKQSVRRGGIRVHTSVRERPVEENVELREEHVRVQRRPVDRPLTAADQRDAFADRVIEATETAEEAVVAKQARVVEEVSLNKEVASRTETVRDTVRETDVDVERVEGDERYRPAYELADELTQNTAYQGREWTQVEPDARRSFEQRHPGSKWDDVKEVVRSRYDRARAR